jgi:predicted ATPase
MITKWKLFNFKSIVKETELEFRPLTIFAGANSSGKSTWIQSMLIISQTLVNRIVSRPVVLNGSLARLGQFDDLRSFGSEAKEIVIGWECQPISEIPLGIQETTGEIRRRMSLYGKDINALKKVSCEISFDADQSSPQRELFQLQPSLFGCILSCVSRSELNVDEQSTISIRRTGTEGQAESDKVRSFGIPDPEDEIIRLSLNYDIDLDHGSIEEIQERLSTAEPVGCFLRHFLPNHVFLRINKTIEDAKLVANTICEDRPIYARRASQEERDVIIPESVLSLLKDKANAVISLTISGDKQHPLFPEEISNQATSINRWNELIRKISLPERIRIRKTFHDNPDLYDNIVEAYRKDRTDEYALVPYRLPNNIQNAVSYLHPFFSNSLKYLGPLRDEPKAIYPLSTALDPFDVGLKGEFTAAVLDLHKKRLVQYMPSISFAEPEIKEVKSNRSLEAAVVDWLQYLCVAEKVHTVDRGKLGHELKVEISGVPELHDLTHVGVGVSQVLPILVSCLLADPDTTLIFEQPELHLHPKVQTLLGDFFLSMTLLGKQCIIETHSEYLISRLRFRAAAAKKDNSIASKMKIYFVEKPQDTSSFREVVVNDYGAIVDWPEGFFDQSQRESEEILRAAMNKKKKQH